MTIQAEDTQSRASIGGHPIHPMLVAFPIASGQTATRFGRALLCGWLAPACSWAPWPPFSD
jgi:uncharacterized membrane protein